MPVTIDKDKLDKSISHLTNDQLISYIHDAFYGPRQSISTSSDSVNSAMRSYTCKICLKVYIIQAKDNRLHQRVQHVINKHESWPEDLQALLINKFKGIATDPLAIAYSIAKIQHTGDNVADQRLLAYILVTRLRAPFSIIEDPLFREVTKFTVPLYRAPVLEAGNTIANSIKKQVQSELPNAFGILFDGWDSPTDYFLAVYAVWGVGDIPQYRFLGIRTFNSVVGKNLDSSDDETELPYTLFEDTPEVDSISSLTINTVEENPFDIEDDSAYVSVSTYQRTAAAHVALIKDILKDYMKTWDNVAFIVCDNCSVNQSISRITNKPKVGCHAHLFNLGCNNFFRRHNETLKKILEIMKGIKKRGPLKNYMKDWTGVVPKLMTSVRWRSTGDMLSSYVNMRDKIPFSEVPELVKFRLTEDEEHSVDELLLASSEDLFMVLDLLESSKANLALAQSWFSALLNNNYYKTYMEDYLKIPSKYFSPLSEAFVLAVCNLAQPAGQQRALTEEESEAVEIFKTKTKQPVSRFKLSFEEPPEYPSLRWIPATTCIVERLFSRARNFLPYSRNRLNATNFENQLLVAVFNGDIAINSVEPYVVH